MTVVALLHRTKEPGHTPEREGVAPQLPVSAADIHIRAGLAQSYGDVVAEAVPVHVSPLALHDVGQALGAEPQQCFSVL